MRLLLFIENMIDMNEKQNLLTSRQAFSAEITQVIRTLKSTHCSINSEYSILLPVLFPGLSQKAYFVIGSFYFR
jgi:hypothetical protein